MNTIVAFDPSLSCTGYAVLMADGERLEDAGIIRADDEQADQYTRAKSITEQALDVLEKYAKGAGGACPIAAVAIEAPRTNGAGMRGKRSTAHLPGYGMVVGTLTYGVDLLRSGYGFELMRPSATEWTRGFPPTNGDQHKERRVALVCHMFNLEADALGPKTIAGNVADAVLLGRWAAGRVGKATL
jgi:hypothetical protein